MRKYIVLLMLLLLAACTDNPSRVQIWGGLGDKQSQFNEPFDVAVDQLGQFSGPTGVAVNHDGQIYIADWGNHRIQKFSK